MQLREIQYPTFTFREKVSIFQPSASCFVAFKKSNSQYVSQIGFRSCFMFFKKIEQSFFKARYFRLRSLWNHQYCNHRIFHIHIFDFLTNYEICTRFVLSEALQKPPLNFGRSRYRHKSSMSKFLRKRPFSDFQGVKPFFSKLVPKLAQRVSRAFYKNLGI